MTRRLALLLLVATSCAGGGGAAPGPAPLPPPRPAAAADAWWNGAVVYEVYVRSFQDSDGDGHGDLPGLIARLDHLNDGDPATTADLGVDALWLMPVNPSPSVHGYDVEDYDGIEPDYGTMADFDRLVAECHRRGLRLVLDFVVNHTSSAHPWFVDSAASPGAQHRSWYVWSPSDAGWPRPWGPGPTWYPGAEGWYYAVFWSGMPDLNWKEPAVRDELSAAARRWLDRGVDGFRLDAVRYLVENGMGSQADQQGTHDGLRAFSGALRAARPDVLLVGEAWADTSTIATYYGSTALVPGGDELPLTFDFPLSEAIVTGVGQGRAQPFAAALDAVTRAYPAGACDAPFLSNHDQVRLASRLAGDAGGLRLAAGLLLTLPGTPFLYYGEELGLPNGSGGCSGDECKRTPMRWDGSSGGGFTSGTPWLPPSGGPATSVAAQRDDPGSLLSAYRTLIRLRASSPALRRGDLQLLQDPAVASPHLAYARGGGGETVLVVHNLGGAWASTGPLQVTGRVAVPLLVPAGASLGGVSGAWSATLPPRSTALWRLDP